MCQEKIFFIILTTPMSGMPMPEIGFLSGQLRLTFLPNKRYIQCWWIRQTTFQLRGGHKHWTIAVPANSSWLMPRCQAMAHLAWEKGKVCRGRAAFDITSQHKTTLSIKARNRPMNLQCCQSIILAKFHGCTVYWQYLLMKAATLVHFMECSETRVATLALIG